MALLSISISANFDFIKGNTPLLPAPKLSKSKFKDNHVDVCCSASTAMGYFTLREISNVRGMGLFVCCLLYITYILHGYSILYLSNDR